MREKEDKGKDLESGVQGNCLLHNDNHLASRERGFSRKILRSLRSLKNNKKINKFVS